MNGFTIKLSKQLPAIIQLILYVFWTVLIIALIHFSWQNILLHITVITIVLTFIYMKKEKYLKIVLALSSMLFIKLIIQLIYAGWNGWATQLSLASGWKIPTVMNANSHYIAYVLFVFIVHYILLKSKKIMLLVITLFIVINAIIFGETRLSLLLLCVTTAVLMQVKVTGNLKIERQKFTAIAIFIAGLLLFSTVLNQQTNTFAQNVQKTLINWKDHQQESGWQRAGRLTETPEKKENEKIAFSVMMENPQPLYLKSIIGTSFHQDNWLMLSNKNALNDASLLYWLNEEGFSSNTMLANAQSVVHNKKTSAITIYNENEQTKYAYIPYGVVKDVQTSKLNKDGVIENQGFRGENKTSYEIADDVLSNYAIIARKLREKPHENTENYLKLEANYRQFVYANYLAVDYKEKKLLKNDFSKVPERSYIQSIEYVQKTLKEHIAYDEKVVLKGDIVASLWADQRAGYSPHYATLGTLAFRLLGIPARYVEGYIIPTAAVENKKSFEKISVPNNDAHAWTEIYLDQIGWVPIEVTPKYANSMPKLRAAYKNTANDEQIEKTAINAPQLKQSKKEKTIEEPDLMQTSQPKKEKKEMNNKYWYIILAIILILLISIFYSVKIYKKTAKSRFLWKQIKKGTPEEQLTATIHLAHYWFKEILPIEWTNEPSEQRSAKLQNELSEDLLQAYEKTFLHYQAMTYGSAKGEKPDFIIVLRKELLKKQSFYKRMKLFFGKGIY